MTRLANTAPSPSRATKAELAAQVATLTTRIQGLEQANAELQSENAALVDNQGHFASLVEHMPAVAFVRDLEGRFKHVNPCYEETYSVLNSSVRGESLHEVLPKKMAEEYAEQDGRVIAEDRVVEREISITLEGSALDYLSIRFPIRDADGKIVAVGGIEQDITARKQAEAALRENEARFRTIIDQLPVSFSLKDSDDRYLVVNQKFQDWFADSEICVPGKSTGDVYDEAFATKLVETDRHVRETGETVTQEIVQPFGDGLMHTTQMTKFPIRLKDDKSILVGTVDVDVTQIKQMEHQLRDSEERFRTLIENTQGIAYRYELDDDYTMQYIGGAVEQITGYPPSDFLAGETGAVRTYASIVHPEDANTIRTEIEEAVNDGREFTIEYRILHRDDTPRWVESIGAAVTGTDGRLKWIDGTLFDISARKKAEEELKLQRKNLHHVLENVPQGVVKWDADQRLSIWNRHYREALSMPDHLIETGRPLKDLTQFLAERGDYGDGDPQDLSDARIEVLYSGDVHRNELTIGGETTYDVLVQPTDDGGIVATYTDITERKAHEDALRRSEEQVRRILEDSPIALAISLDDQSEDDGVLQFANAQFLSLMGFSKADIGAARTESFLAKQSANREKHEAALDAGESLHNMEQLVVGKDGHDIWTLMSISPIEYRERKAALIWLYDITEQKNAELEIRRSHERLNTILESSPMGIAVTRRDNGRTLYTNARLAEQLQLGDDRKPGRDLSAYWADPKDRETILGRARQENFVENVEVRRRRSDGSTFWALMSALPLNYEGKDALLSWTYDITERKDAEEAQRKSERTANTLREAIEVFSDSVILYDKDERVVFTNHKYHELYPNSPCKAEIAGYSQEELLRSSVQNGLIDDPLAKTNPEAWIARRLHERRQNRDFSGETNHSNGHTYLLRHKPTTTGGLIVAHTDITERKEAEDRFRALLDSAPDATVIVNVNGEIVEANLQTENLFGYATDKIVGRKVEMLLPDRLRRGHPVHRETFIRSAEARPMGIGLELFAQAKDGREFPIEISLSPIETHEGTLVSASVRDISQRKQAENDLRIAKEQAEAALAGLKQTQARLVQTEKMASLGELTAGIAHEIKNPLNFVNNFSETSVELLDELKEVLEPVQGNFDNDARDDVDEIFGTLKGDLEKIKHHGQRADNIVKSMLLHARGEASEPLLTQVNDLVQEAFNLAYHGERARDKNFQATLEQNFDDAAGQAELIPQEITRVLVNMFSNAFYAVNRRSKDAASSTYAPTVTVWTEDSGEDVQIRIRDNGTGMPEDVREKLFDPFFTTKPTGEGTGLGLSMSFDIIAQQHGGHIDVISEPSEFTEFTITLPRHPRGAQ